MGGLPPLVVLAASIAAAALCAALGMSLLLYERRLRAQRLRSAVGPRAKRGARGGGAQVLAREVWSRKAVSYMRLATARASLVKARHGRELKLRLLSAGFRSRDAIVVYAFFKLVGPFVLLAGAAFPVYGLGAVGRGPLVDAVIVLAAGLLGSRLPDLVVGSRRKKRLESIRKALPDTLDMLVICAEAGLASDAALKRVVAETGRTPNPLSDELMQATLELGLTPDRRQAFENLAARVPLPSMNAFVTTLLQAEKYGTPLARAFKVLAQEQRAERMLRAEEKAGRLPATMTVPMMLFILPALFVVLLGPAALSILDNFLGG